MGDYAFMDVYLDQQQLALERPTLRAAFDEAIRLSGEAGRVIVEIHADGEPLSAELLSNPPDEMLDAAELRFLTAEPRMMVREILMQAADALDQAQGDQQSAAEQIHKGDLDTARRLLEQSVSLWQMVLLAVQRGGELIEVDLLELEAVGADGAGAGPVRDRVGKLGEDLTEIMRALENEDWSTLSDMLEDEMSSQCGLWRDTLRGIATTVGG